MVLVEAELIVVFDAVARGAIATDGTDAC